MQSKSKSKKVVNDVRDILEALNELKSWGKAIQKLKQGEYDSNKNGVSSIKDHRLVGRMNSTEYSSKHTGGNGIIADSF